MKKDDSPHRRRDRCLNAFCGFWYQNRKVIRDVIRIDLRDEDIDIRILIYE